MRGQGKGFALPGRATSLWRAASRFRSETRGSLAVLGLLLLVMMVMMGGIAVDLMRYESTRTSLQNTLDRSTLAAASLTNQVDPAAVVNDYFLKAGLANYLTGVEVDQGANYRSVTADARADSQPLFLHMMGIESFIANGHSRAEQRIDNVEIILALDISGSMSGAKIANLITSANDFVNTVLNSDPDQHISIGIVPYNAQVNLPPELLAEFTVNHPNGVDNDNCLELPPSVFTTSGLDLSTGYSEMAFADTTSSTTQSTSYVSTTSGAPNFSSAYCRRGTMNQILLPTKDMAVLHAKINALTAGGNTSIMYGMRWALELLDPSVREMYRNLIAGGYMNANLDGHPFDYTNTETLKVIILMTDGEHTRHEMIDDAYKDGPSPIYKSTGDGYYSIRHTSGRPVSAGTNEYWVPHLCVSTNCKAGTDTSEAWRATPYDSGGGAVQLDWKDVWATFRDSYVAWQFYARALGTSSSTRSSNYTAAINAFENLYAPTTTMDSQLQEVCSQAKTNSVVVYGIAFEAPANGQAQIRACSTSDAHYFDATTMTIGTAFKAIANNISQLRLTQ